MVGRPDFDSGWGWWELPLVLILGLLLAWLAGATPQPLPASASAGRFSAGRAMLDIKQLAQTPHPVGSIQDGRVRDLLVAKLNDLGLAPDVRVFDRARVFDRPADQRTYRVADVLARVDGRDKRLPAILVMSHYDSVPLSPGAADDMAAVASALEMARLLRLYSPERDVLFAFTDGEEAGLVGAGALLADPLVVRGIGVVVNMDVRGGGGRALMFQTGRQAGGLQRLYAAHSLDPAGNSLAAYLYGLLPNDTDFTVALRHGLTGLNYAFIGRPALYHTPAAVPQAVEAGAVQSLGEQAWMAVQALADSPRLPAAGPDLTWFDLFGQGVVIYSPALGWAPLLASGALLLIAIERQGALRRTMPALGAGALRTLGATLLSAGLLFAYARLWLHGYYAALSRALWTEAAIAVACLACVGLVFRTAPAADRPVGRWAGAVFLAWVIALVLQAIAPRTAFVAEWPVLLASVALFAVTLGLRGARGATLVCAATSLGFLFEIEHMLVLGVGLTLPVAGVALLPFALAVLTPLLQGTIPTGFQSSRDLVNKLA